MRLLLILLLFANTVFAQLQAPGFVSGTMRNFKGFTSEVPFYDGPAPSCYLPVGNTLNGHLRGIHNQICDIRTTLGIITGDNSLDSLFAVLQQQITTGNVEIYQTIANINLSLTNQIGNTNDLINFQISSLSDYFNEQIEAIYDSLVVINGRIDSISFDDVNDRIDSVISAIEPVVYVNEIKYNQPLGVYIFNLSLTDSQTTNIVISDLVVRHGVENTAMGISDTVGIEYRVQVEVEVDSTGSPINDYLSALFPPTWIVSKKTANEVHIKVFRPTTVAIPYKHKYTVTLHRIRDYDVYPAVSGGYTRE